VCAERSADALKRKRLLVLVISRIRDAAEEPSSPDEHRLYSCDGLILHVREDMSVGVQCERCAGMS
jgi:hypothetical protein